MWLTKWGKHGRQVVGLQLHLLYMYMYMLHVLPIKARTIICNSYIQPYLDYCCTIWGNTTQSNLLRLYRLQKYAARLIFDYFESPSHVLLTRLDWLPVNLRIDYHKLVLVHTSLNCQAPEYMSNLFKITTKKGYCTRSTLSKLLYSPKFRTEL